MNVRRSLLAAGLLFFGSAMVQAQIFPPFPGNGDGNFGGIVIDAQGVVASRQVKQASTAAIQKQVKKYAAESLPADVVTQSEHRVLSLRKLEKTILEALERGGELPEPLRYLGGLQRIDAVVFDPAASDVLIVGPAEGFGPDHLGRMVGVTTGRPPMQLDDLVTALRSAASGERSVGCSIDPAKDNLARLQQYLAANSYPAGLAEVQQRYVMMGKVLGQQEVTVWGVPKDSHFAVALVEADFRMKQIALGTEPSGVHGIPSHLALLAPQGNSLQRWWFVPMYEPLQTNQQGTVFVLRGQRARVKAQEEISDAAGRRTDSAFTRPSTQKFAQMFTEHFPELAAKSPPFAELQSLYDLAVLGLLVQMQGARHLTDWDLSTLLRDRRLPVSKYPTPLHVSSQATFKQGGSGGMVGLIGGVQVDVSGVVGNPVVTPGVSDDGVAATIPDGGWFGDAGGK